MRSRIGFTLLEVLVVVLIMGIVGTTAMMSVSASMTQTRVQRAASVISTDLRLAQSMAERQRRPVEVVFDPTARVMRVRDAANPATVFSERHFGLGGEYPVRSMDVSPTSMVVFPNGLTSTQVTVTLRWADRQRVVTMTRAGQVRVSS
jgi:type II secretion system protein H